VYVPQKTTKMESNTMKVDVWSDIMCPFCYIGKRHYEAALQHFADSAGVEIVWHSFQLDPDIPAHPDKAVNVYQYLADRKGISYQQSAAMHQNVVKMAREAGLNYNFDKAVVANSFDAHRLIQMAKLRGVGDAAEELLFRAYFTEGKNFADHDTLMALGRQIGLSEADVKAALTDEKYAALVRADIRSADEMKINGVPFFVFDGKYTVSGAQPPEMFLKALQKSFTEWKKNNTAGLQPMGAGKVCTPGKDCE
jgi:protein disulfide-isomerase